MGSGWDDGAPGSKTATLQEEQVYGEPCGWLLLLPLPNRSIWLLPTPQPGPHCYWVADLAVISGVSYQGESHVILNASLPSLSF